MATLEEAVEAAAQAAHEANRAYCEALGDHSQLLWSAASDEQRESAREGVQNVLAGASPRASHQAWWERKHREGWTYGVLKDPILRTHPCCVPFDALPQELRMKDAIFVRVAGALLTALGHPPVFR